MCPNCLYPFLSAVGLALLGGAGAILGFFRSGFRILDARGTAGSSTALVPKASSSDPVVPSASAVPAASPDPTVRVVAVAQAALAAVQLHCCGYTDRIKQGESPCH